MKITPETLEKEAVKKNAAFKAINILVKDKAYNFQQRKLDAALAREVAAINKEYEL